MENQHRKIKGYRELSEKEINLMNDIKIAEKELLELIDQVPKLEISLSDLQKAESTRFAALAKTSTQQASMWAVRSVALPDVV